MAEGSVTEPVPTNLDAVYETINEHWSPKVVAELNGQQVKVAKIKGEFCWHAHADEDELFLVIKGQLKIELRDGVVKLGPGDLYVVPKGVEHRPVALEEVQILLFEPAGTINTGETDDPRRIEI